MVTAYKRAGNPADLQAAVEQIITTAAPVDYSGWTLAEASATLSFAHPDNWRVENKESNTLFQLFDPTGNKFEIDTVETILPAVEAAGAGWEAVETANYLPYRTIDEIAIAHYKNGDDHLLFGASETDINYSSLRFRGSAEQVASVRPIFEQVLRSLRGRVVPSLFDPNVALDKVADDKLLGRDFYFLSGQSADNTPITYNVEYKVRFADDLTMRVETPCGELTGTFINPVEYYLDIALAGTTDCEPPAWLSGRKTYLIGDEMLIFNTTDNELIAFGNRSPSSDYPHSRDELAALAPLILDAFRERTLATQFEPLDQPLFENATRWRVTWWNDSTEIHVFDDAPAATNVTPVQLPANTRLWQRDRYLLTWSGTENYDIENMLNKLFGDSILQAEGVVEKPYDADLGAGRWFWIGTMQPDGTATQPPLTEESVPYLHFQKQTRDNRWMLEMSVVCGGFAMTYTIDTMGEQLTLAGLMDDGFPSCGDLPTQPIEENGQYGYVIDGDVLTLEAEGGSSLLFARGDAGADRPNESLITQVEQMLQP